jgi:hypothetical protein
LLEVADHPIIIEEPSIGDSGSAPEVPHSTVEVPPQASDEVNAAASVVLPASMTQEQAEPPTVTDISEADAERQEMALEQADPNPGSEE